MVLYSIICRSLLINSALSITLAEINRVILVSVSVHAQVPGLHSGIFPISDLPESRRSHAPTCSVGLSSAPMVILGTRPAPVVKRHRLPREIRG